MLKSGSLVGKQIDQFRLDEFIAKGAMGMVFKAFDSVLARTVALKLIPKVLDEDLSEMEMLSQEEAKKRLIQEAKAAGRLSHPNIVTIHSYGETPEFQYICMEYVRGKTLTQFVKERKAISEQEAISLFEQILLALEAANGEDIIHRDIKPANIMITEDNRLKVMDFGIAKLPSLSMTVTGMVLGTPYYMSPEQISGKKVDIRSDIFSVGAVIYELLTGGRPFEAENTAALTFKIMQENPLPANVVNSRISQPMADIISKALAKDPAQRYQSPTEMLKELRNLQGRLTRVGAGRDAGVSGPAPPIYEQTVVAEKQERQERQERQEPPSKVASSRRRASELSEKELITEAPPSVKRLPEGETEEDDGALSPVPPRPPKKEARHESPTGLAGEERAKSKRDEKTVRPLAMAALLVVALVVGIVLFKSTRPSPSPPAAPPASPPASIPRDITPPSVKPSPAKEPPKPSVDGLLLEAGKEFVRNPSVAQKLLEEAISLDPNNFDSLITLARLLAFRKEYAAAVQHYREALRVNSRAFEAHYEVGCLYIALNEYDAAVQSLESCLALSPPNKDEVLTNLGFCYYRMDKPEQARLLYQQALDINPRNQLARSLMDSLALAAPKVPSPDTASVGTHKLEGEYKVEGVNPNRSKYNGTATIKRSGSGYSMTWNIGSQTFTGNGSLTGNTLTINWKGGGSGEGSVIYTVKPGGVLQGVWANGTGSETLTPAR